MKNIDFSYFETGLASNDELVLFSKENNISLCIDLKEMKLKEVDFLPLESLDKKNLVSDIKKKNDKTYYIPRNAKYLYIKNEEGFKTIDFSEYFNINMNNKFMCSLIYNEYLFLFGHWVPYILGINLKSETVEYVYKIPEELVLMKEEKKDAYFYGIWKEGDIAYLPFLSGEFIVKMYLNSKKIEWIKIPFDSGFTNINKLSKDDFVLSCRNGKGLVIYNEKDNRVQNVFDILDLRYSLGIFFDGQQKWIPCYNGESYLLDFSNQKYKKTKIGYLSIFSKGNKYLALRKNEMEIIEKYGNANLFPPIDFSSLDTLINSKKNMSKYSIDVLLEESQLFDLNSYLSFIV